MVITLLSFHQDDLFARLCRPQPKLQVAIDGSMMLEPASRGI
jgi:hypothetical protein